MSIHAPNFREDDLNTQNNLADVNIEQIKEGKFLLKIKNAHIRGSESNIPQIAITFEKTPMRLEVGKEINNEVGNSGGVLDENPSELMEQIMSEVETLKNVDDVQKIDGITKVIHKYLQYPTKEKIEQIHDEKLKKWVEEVIVPRVGSQNLSQILEKGYGICNNFAATYLWLADSIGLQGRICAGQIKNIMRSDNPDKKLFGTLGLGQKGGHAWVEIRKSDGEWVQVDPTVGISETNIDGKIMFKEAGYEQHVLQKNTNSSISRVSVASKIYSTSGLPYVFEDVSIERNKKMVLGPRKNTSQKENEDHYDGDLDIMFSTDEKQNNGGRIVGVALK